MHFLLWLWLNFVQCILFALHLLLVKTDPHGARQTLPAKGRRCDWCKTLRFLRLQGKDPKGWQNEAHLCLDTAKVLDC